jgi:carbonyl reductase 1
MMMSALRLLLVSTLLLLSDIVAEAFSGSSSNNYNNPSNMKRVLITGANKGIGKACCQKLLEEHSDVFVYLACRSVERGEQAAKDIMDAMDGTTSNSSPARIAVVAMDVSSTESVQGAAAKIQSLLQKEDADNNKLYGIINNAGISQGEGDSVVDTNYYGTKRVVEAFLPLLQRPGGRIVNIASASGPNFVAGLSSSSPLYQSLKEPWTIEGGLDGVDAIAQQYMTQYGSSYGFSKALVNAYTLLLARSQQPDLVINSVTPGWIKTDMTVGHGATNPPSQGAIPPVWALMDPSLESTTTGLYYGSDCKRSPIHQYRSPGDPVYTGPTGMETTSNNK